MQISINVQEIITKTGNKFGFEKYAYIMQTFPTIDVSVDRYFQKKFNGFYRVRRNIYWQNVYYTLLERCKTTPMSFEDVLYTLFKQTGRIEASFSSKLLHTVNSDMPIWDKYVLEKFGKRVTGKTKEERLQNTVRIYKEITDWYTTFLATPEAQTHIRQLNAFIPNYLWISPTKKIDFLLWQMR